MTAGQTVNLIGSITALSGALAFALVYTLFAPWWRSRIGRLLVIKALAMSAFMVISVAAYAVDPVTGRHIGLLLVARGVLATGYGVLMIYQAWLVSTTQLRGSQGPGDI